MNDFQQYEFLRGAPPARPVFLECDRRGQVLWMSDYAREALQQPRIPKEDVPLVIPASQASNLRVLRLLEREDRVLISMFFSQPGDDAAREEWDSVAALRDRLLRHYFQLQRSEQSLSALAQRTKTQPRTSAVVLIDEERRRLGRELHTGVGQMLAAIQVQVELAGSELRNQPPAVEQALNRISKLASEALDQVRAVSRRLHPPEWQRLTLRAALEELWDLSGIPQRYHARLRLEPLLIEPEFEIKILMYRAAQEAISNFTLHAHADSIEMRLEARGDLLVLAIKDNGIGFDVQRQSALSGSSGLGLRAIREQAASVGGRLVIESGPGGTLLEIYAPYPGGRLSDE